MKLKQSRREKHTFLYIAIFLMVAAISVMLPQVLISAQVEQTKNQVEQTYASAYRKGSGRAVRMSLYERMKLISGEWDSEYREIPIEEVAPIKEAEKELSSQVSVMQTGDLEAEGYAYLTMQTVLSKAAEGMKIFYETGICPEEVVSEYQNWYRPRIALYQYEDAVFHVYSCYVWMVQYDYYDGSRTHSVLVDDTTGLILAYGVKGNGETKYELPDSYVQSVKKTESNLVNVHGDGNENGDGNGNDAYEAIHQYYASASSLSEDYLVIQEEPLTLSGYSLWEDQYTDIEDTSDKSVPDVEAVCMFFEKQGVADYTSALQESREKLDNDKYLYIVQIYSDRVEIKYLPFTSKIR